MPAASHSRLLILGSGPAGYTATLYASRANLNPLLITGIEVGGQLTTTTEVENWPGGHAELQGPELMMQMAEHIERFDCSVQNDHIHLMVEASETKDLSRYMQGLQIRFAKALNKLWGRKGKVFADRFFAKACPDWRAVRAVTRYILNNDLRHGLRNWRIEKEADPYSSGPWYARWTHYAWSRFKDPDALWPVVHPRSSPYEFYARIAPDDVPGHAVRARYANGYG